MTRSRQGPPGQTRAHPTPSGSASAKSYVTLQGTPHAGHTDARHQTPNVSHQTLHGTPLPEGAVVADEAAVIEALKTVHDPEIPVNIYDLGLIYDVERFGDGTVKIEMTLTAPACPVAGEMPKMVADAVAKA